MIFGFSRTLDEHLNHLRALFMMMRENKLILKFQKCFFFRQQLKYLGYVISKNGLHPNEKLVAIQNIPVPTTVKAVRSFLGCVGFYRRFNPDFATLAKPLTQLTHKSKESYKFHTQVNVMGK